MDATLRKIKSEVYDSAGLTMSDYKAEIESTTYSACIFMLNGRRIIGRNAKITPKKAGQFVTFWKRYGKGPITPFRDNDRFDFFVVNVQSETKLGQFVFPKSILITKGIISTELKEGKRALRVYPIWDTVEAKQALRTQKWQLAYFYEISASTNLKRVLELYTTQQ